jgi:phospholipid/cholesterol/gamma-HCH transport system substrate-binding protein
MKQIEWKDLTVGLIALGAVAGAALAVLLFAQVGGVRGPKATLYVTAASARGVLRTTEVMVGGQRVGTINRIDFLPPSPDTLRNLVVEIEVLRSALPLIRRDSYAEIRPSGTIIGAPVIDISVGSATMPALSPGDTLAAVPQVATERFLDRVGVLGEEFGGALQDWREVAANVRSARGTLGAVRTRGPHDFATFRAQVTTLMRRLDRGGGTVALALSDDQIGRRVRRVVAQADTIGTLLGSERGSVGRFRRDDTLLAEIAAVRSELAVLSAALTDARGTAGRVQEDRAIARELAVLRDQLDLLIEDLKENPLRYIAF